MGLNDSRRQAVKIPDDHTTWPSRAHDLAHSPSQILARLDREGESQHGAWSDDFRATENCLGAISQRLRLAAARWSNDQDVAHGKTSHPLLFCVGGHVMPPRDSEAA